MSAPRMEDVLLDSGGAWLTKYGVPFLRRADSGRYEPEAYTFSRADASTVASLVARNGVLRRAVAGKLRPTWDYTRAAPGLLMESGAAGNLITQSENFGTWSTSGTPVLVSGQADPFGGTAAYSVEDNDGGVVERVYTTVSFTGDGTKALSIFMRVSGTLSGDMIGLWDFTATTWRHKVTINWTSGVPALVSSTGSGVLFPVQPLAGGWYRVAFSADNVVAANSNALYIGSDSASWTGTHFLFGAQAENSRFPSSYIKTSGAGASRATDALSMPIGFGPEDFTVYAKVARPAWADVTGSLGIYPVIATFGAGTGSTGAWIYGGISTRVWQLYMGGAAVSTSIPAGDPLELCAQFRYGTDQKCRLDVGSGFGSLSSAATDLTFTETLARIGCDYTGNPFGGSVERVLAARGLYTLSEMQEAAAR